MSIKHPQFSIIIPVYNTEKYISQCIESIILQTFKEFEIIIIDDGSTDNSKSICEEYANKYPQIRLISKINEGPGAARNIGIQEARGKYLTFTDSDDFWENSYVLEDINELISKHSYPDIIISDIIKYYDLGTSYVFPSIVCNARLNGKSKQTILDHLFYEHSDMKMSACQKFVKTVLAKDIPFDQEIYCEDIDWSLLLYPKAQNICLYHKPYYCYRQQPSGSRSCTATAKSFNSIIHILDKHESLIKKHVTNKTEQSVYLGYLSYQLAMAINNYGGLPPKDKQCARYKIKAHQHLFRYPSNSKTKKIKYLYRLLGVDNTAKIFKMYLKMRTKHHTRL